MNDISAIRNIANMTYNGFGIKKDYLKAIENLNFN